MSRIVYVSNKQSWAKKREKDDLDGEEGGEEHAYIYF
jgi:hypothetical protein